VLFIVSAGNHPDDIALHIPQSEFWALRNDPHRLQAEILSVLNGMARNRRVRPPAEAVNALTVGALHSDTSTTSLHPRLIDPFIDECMPSPISAQGTGFRRSVKPEVLFPGGRQVYVERPLGSNGNIVLEASTAVTRGPG
jgi:hypothetical protein